MSMQKISKFLKNLWFKYTQFSQGKAVDTLEWEISELEHVFTLLTFSAFVGLPAPPMQITLDLMPSMEKELVMMVNKIDTANAPLSDLFSVLDVS